MATTPSPRPPSPVIAATSGDLEQRLQQLAQEITQSRVLIAQLTARVTKLENP